MAAATMGAAFAREPSNRLAVTFGPDRTEAPPRRFRLTRDNFHLGRTIGILFDGVPRRDVLAYDADEGWIETERHNSRLNGRVEPYWRKFEETFERHQVDPQARIDRAEAKRARKAAKIVGRAS
ncbi:hypothetical protein NKJ26_03170 [Mesorhizobium sp. M0152]|uniref:hypothetical protein n=1 Tax=Mesorhizobium sp. M0152 TaxID=2956898 RepID=UPI00333C78E3